MVSVNELASTLIEETMDYAEDYEEEYRIKFHRLNNGAVVIDCGVKVKGSIAAGIFFSEICMATLAEIDVKMLPELPIPVVDVRTDSPAIACLASQKAGWCINLDNYFAMGSGPARALALKPRKTYEEIKYEDDAECAVINLESDKLPDEKVVEYIAKECDVECEDVYVLVAPTASIVGSVQISSRVVETALYRIFELGFDVRKIVSACGIAPIAPVAENNVKAMGLTNDCIIYGGNVFLFSDFDKSEFEKLKECNLTSDKSKDYGKPFYEIFKDSGYDFYKIDKSLFAPAKLTVNNLSGEVITSGKLRFDLIKLI